MMAGAGRELIALTKGSDGATVAERLMLLVLNDMSASRLKRLSACGLPLSSQLIVPGLINSYLNALVLRMRRADRSDRSL